MDWESLKQEAVKIFQKYGIPPAVGMSQMALESGRGTSNRSRTQNNLFGYMVYSDNAPGKTYSSPLESIEDYAKLISQDPRYKEAMKHNDDPVRMVQEIKKAGYATDPDYVTKLINMPEFREFQDLPAKPTKDVKGAKTSNVSTPVLKGADAYTLQQQGIKSPLLMKDYGVTPVQKKGVLDYVFPKTPQGEDPLLRKILFPRADASMSNISYSQPYNATNNSGGYAVKPGDTLWSIAAKYLGAGNRYPELGYKGNPNTLPVGTRINIPQPKPTQPTSTVSKPVSSGSMQNYSPVNANYSNAKTGAASYAPPPVNQKINTTRPTTSSGLKLDFTPAPMRGAGLR